MMKKIKKHSKSREGEGRDKKKDKNWKMGEMRQTEGCDNQGYYIKSSIPGMEQTLNKLALLLLLLCFYGQSQIGTPNMN